MGDTSRKVFAIVMAEGVVLGVALALGIWAIGIPMPPPPNSNLGYVAEIRLVPSVMAAAFVTGLAAAVLASVLPALRASRIPIAEALRQNV
jgi:putative ABC transport system permease protein